MPNPTLAVLADLHGNLPALDAVLADLERVQPDRVVVAGDFVNRGPQGRAVLERIAPYGFASISGNHDTWLASLARGLNHPPEWETSWWTPVRLAVAELTPEWVAYLEALPATLRVELPGAAPIRLVHGSPRGSRDGMGRLRSDADLLEALAGVEERTVIGAHIHYPYEREVGGKHVVVVGAVGCPFNGDVNAQYGLFTWDGERPQTEGRREASPQGGTPPPSRSEAGGAWRFEHRSVPYDHAPVYAAWRAGGYLDDGSLASELMLLEHRTARTQYVPFWDWALEHNLPLTRTSHAHFAASRPAFVPIPRQP